MGAIMSKPTIMNCGSENELTTSLAAAVIAQTR
jgi:hypothetical protein